MKEVAKRRWITFVLLQQGPKTSVWRVQNIDAGTPLGTVKWFGRWRGYAFFPGAELVFEKICLRDIADFIERENEAHRARRRA